MRILGLSAYYHDAAAALLDDGRVVAAAQEERFTRRKHDSGFPIHAARFCLERAGIGAADLDAVAYYEKPFLKFDRLLAEAFATAPRGLVRFCQAMPLWLGSRLWLRSEIERRLDTAAPVHFLLHHESHAASAFGPSPFPAAAVLTLDGVGEWTTNGVWRAAGDRLEPLLEIRYPDSLGLLYSAFTAYTGFRVNDGEYKLMGLAPYGQPTYAAAIRDHLIELRDDGSYRLNQEYFAYRHRQAMTGPRFHALFGGPPHLPGTPLGRRDADLACSIQQITEEIILRQARFARAEVGLPDLCLAGGVALNCVANGRLARAGIFERLWVQPAAGDAGGALGAAWALWLRLARPGRAERDGDAQEGSLLGPDWDEEAMAAAIAVAGRQARRLEPAALADETARALAAGEVVAWYQGRMEFGPRSLGNRSILADPRAPGMQSRINLAVKFRESFRPFAPVVRAARADAWFDIPAPSPYMLLTGTVRGATRDADPVAQLETGRGVRTASPIPAVTHVDGSARVQTVPVGANPPLEDLLDRFEAATGCPVLLNTSFNVKDEPIVCSPADALHCFGRTKIDRLVLGPFVVPAGPATPTAPPPMPRPQLALGRVALELAATGAATVLALILHAPRLATAVAAVGVVFAVLRLAAQRARAAVDAGLAVFGRIVADVLALPLLALVFLAVVTPVGRLRRRRPGPAPSTFWRPPADPDHDPRRPG
jgi:carbamoyltransferase